MSRRVAVVAHTHWDREWYSPFEVFRARLVAAVDELLETLESDPDFRTFLLDGQMAAVDDYLAVRPDRVDTLQRLARAGRLTMGPWYVLMDEFCVSGETIVRNLQRGLARAAQVGDPATPAVGYLPDMFGHVAQMPQILQAAGISHAVVWRGVPAAIERTGFLWDAPDGSRVRAEYLPVGYANGACLPPDPESLVRRVEAHAAEVSPYQLSPDAPLLLMNGGDHQGPQTWMPTVLDAANAIQDRLRFEQTSLPDYLARAPSGGLPAWTGELRSGARANLLMGVLSNRVDIKVAAAVAERSLERVAEPLAALWLPPDLWPAELVDEAWAQLIANSAHDSVCGCSVDEVTARVLERYAVATALAAEVTSRATAIGTVATRQPGPVVLNPSPTDRSGLVELVLSGTSPPAGTQLLEQVAAGEEVRSGRGADLGRLLAELGRDGWLGPTGRGTDARLDVTPDGVEVTVTSDESRPAAPAMAVTMAEAWAQAGAHRHDPLTVRVTRAGSQRVLARVDSVPGYGWKVWTPQPVGVDRVEAGPDWLDNGLARVVLDPATGEFALNGRPGFGRLIDGGDDGDTYNYSPPGDDTIVDRPASAAVEIVEPGPLRAVLRVRRTYAWPAAISNGRRIGSEPVEVMTDIEVRAGDSLVRVTVAFDNRCRDHRLRVWLPLPEPAHTTTAECAFGTVVRADTTEGGPNEHPLPTFPSRRFVRAGGFTVIHEGLLEYELVDDGLALALTLLRATGTLAKPAPAYRPNVAGPPAPVPAAELLGPRQARFALAMDRGPVDPWRLADEAWTPLPVVTGTGTGHLPSEGRRLTVDGAQVSALHRRHGRLEVRLFNPTDAPTTARIPGHRGQLVDLRDQPVAAWDQQFDIPPHGIVTARLDSSSLD